MRVLWPSVEKRGNSSAILHSANIANHKPGRSSFPAPKAVLNLILVNLLRCPSELGIPSV
jgi:hypothetical protein